MPGVDHHRHLVGHAALAPWGGGRLGITPPGSGDYWQQLAVPGAETDIRFPGNISRFSATPLEALGPPPTIGQHTEAVLGAEIAVTTLDGSTVRLKVPAGSRNGRTLRAKGRGVYGHDLLVTIEVAVPQHVGAEERALLEQLAELERQRPNPREALT